MPGAPPVRQLISAFTVSPASPAGLAGPVLMAAAGTAVMAGLLVTAGCALAGAPSSRLAAAAARAGMVGGRGVPSGMVNDDRR